MRESRAKRGRPSNNAQIAKSDLFIITILRSVHLTCGFIRRSVYVQTAIRFVEEAVGGNRLGGVNPHLHPPVAQIVLDRCTVNKSAPSAITIAPTEVSYGGVRDVITAQRFLRHHRATHPHLPDEADVVPSVIGLDA